MGMDGGMAWWNRDRDAGLGFLLEANRSLWTDLRNHCMVEGRKGRTERPNRLAPLPSPPSQKCYGTLSPSLGFTEALRGRALARSPVSPR